MTDTRSKFERLETGKGYNILKFPEDIDVNGSQNIMMININAVEGSRYKGKEYKTIQGEDIAYQQSQSSALGNRMQGVTRRIDTTVALYMPAEIESQYGAEWTSTDLGSIGAAIDAGMGIADVADMDGAEQVWESVKQMVPEAAAGTLSGTFDTLTRANTQDARKAFNRTISNPYTEVVFNGVENRSFSFTFKFIPTSRREQEQIRQIVNTLKFHRAPEVKYGEINNYFLFPSEFDIKFLHSGEENSFLFRISTCAMTNFTVKHGGGSTYASFDDGTPFSTEITMEFMELEQLTKERHKQGY